jgi:hypothetical protein
MPLLENDEKYWLAAEVIADMKPPPVAHAFYLNGAGP